MTDPNRPVPLTSPLLGTCRGVGHGFFTREGGVSAGLYAHLNCGPGSDDDRAAVMENRARATAAIGAATLCTAYQIHSPDVVVVNAPWEPADAPKADGLVTRARGLAIGVLTADCVPVLFADAEAGVIGAAHAGWKGAVAGVLETTVTTMIGEGATLGRIRAAVGPAIQQASYEVGPEFRARFIDEDKGNDRFFRPSARADHFLFDLPGYVAMCLGMMGLDSGAVEVMDHDTRADAARFFSYRRATLEGEADYGRQLSAIVLAGE